MTDKEAAREAVAALVEKFRSTPKAERDAYNEDETRHFFILPLFRALGWDTESPADMSAEEQISRGFVDFGFYLNGVPAFYLETKRVREDLEKDEFIRQAVNYAYLKGVTWAVLTDFEGLHIYNAEWETHIPAQARYLMLGWEEYAEGDFNDLWLLSKPAMQERLLDKAATKHGKKARRAPVTELLFKNMTDWRGQLFNQLRFLSGQIWGANVREIDNAVQRLLDRLIFLRTVEDRGLEPPRLKEIVRQNEKSPGKIWPKLLELFTEMNEVYNSNLFAPAQLDLLNLHDPDLIRGIINDLYKYAGVEFDFNAISADVLGAVYEQYLGFRALDLESRDEMKGKQEKRKKQGIYYTPQYIVRYIVQQTVGRLLEDGADPHALRIVDPACGSGSFLIEAFDVLDRWLATHEKHIPAGERRRRILTENLYGVDLDEQAVEVTRLNLLLRASLERGKLPLLTNIQRGNSLIEDPAVAGEAAFGWETAFPEVFAAGGFDAVIGNPPYVRQEKHTAAEKSHYEAKYESYAGTADLYIYFIERGMGLLKNGGRYGIIVANKWLRAAYGKPLRRWLKTQTLEEIIDFGDLPVFQEAVTYPCILRARRSLLADSGAEPQFYAAQMDTLDYADLEAYVRERRYPVSRAALDDAGWSLARQDAQAVLDKLRRAGVPLGEYVGGAIYRGVLTGLNNAFVISDAVRRELIRRDPRSADLIKPFLLGRDVRRYETPPVKQYVIFTRRGVKIEEYPAILEHLEQFRTQLEPRPLDWKGSEWPGRKPGAYEWYEIQDTVDYYEAFERPKITYAEISTRGQFVLDTQHLFCDTTAYVMGSDSLYLLAILNSTLWTFMFAHTGSQIRGGFLRWKRQYMAPLPIRTINADDPADVARHDQIVGLVEEMIALKQRMAEPQMSFSDERFIVGKRIEDVDRAIDTLVYELYGLTNDEIALVEGTA